MTKHTSQTNSTGGIPEQAAGGVLRIDLDALASNWRTLRDHAGGLRAFERGYGWLLDRALRFRFLVWVAFVASIGAAGWMAVTIPKGFFPVEDTGLLSVSTEGPRGSSMDAMAEMQNRLAETFSSGPDVGVTAKVGVEQDRAVPPFD